jgi:hypothetical protein
VVTEYLCMFENFKRIMARTQGMFLILAAMGIIFILPWITSSVTGMYIDESHKSVRMK